jgi:hypothetical protein
MYFFLARMSDSRRFGRSSIFGLENTILWKNLAMDSWKLAQKKPLI